MWYRFEVWVPDSDTEPNPVEYRLRLPPGVIKNVRVRFPPGPNNKVSIRIMLGTHQMWPRGPPAIPDYIDPAHIPVTSYWFRGDDEVIEWEDHVPTQAGDHWFAHVKTDTCNHNHTIIVGFNVIETEYAQPLDPVWDLVKTLKNLIGL